MAASAVSTPYSYETCLLATPTFDGGICVLWISVEVDSAAVIPPYTYNNQCASVLLTAYIPVPILGFSIQLVLCFVLPVILNQVGKRFNLEGIIHRKLVKGILWPEFWLDSEDSGLARIKKSRLEKDSTIVLSPKTILCFDILNNLMVLLSFGLCSPILALAVMCVVVSKMNMWVLFVGRFTSMLRGDSNTSMHFALVALADVHLPLNEVFQRSFWLIAWCSAFFCAFVCWDIAADDVGWTESVWIPVTMLCYPLLLWVVLLVHSKHSGDQLRCRVRREEKSSGNSIEEDSNIELASPSFVNVNNPIHSG